MEMFKHGTQTAGVEMSLKTSLCVSLCDLTDMSFLVSLFWIFLHPLYLTLESGWVLFSLNILINSQLYAGV